MKTKVLSLLADVITTNNNAYEENKIYITEKDIRHNMIINKNKIKGNKLPKKNVSNLMVNDILISKLENYNDVILIDESNKDYIYSSDFLIIRIRENHRSVLNYLLSEDFKLKKDSILSGIKKRFLKISTVENLEIPILTEEDCNDLEVYWKNYYNVVKDTYDLFNRNTNKMDLIGMNYFSGKYNKDLAMKKNEGIPFEIPGTWKALRINDVCNKVFDGQKKNLKCLSEGVPILYDYNLVDNELVFDKVKYVSQGESYYININFHPEKNDILINNKDGNSYLIKTDPNFNVSDGLIVLKPNIELINPEYLYLLLNSHYIKFLIKNKMNYIDATGIKNAIIPIPSLDEQEYIIKILLEYEEKNKEIKRRGLEKIKELEQELLGNIKSKYQK